jgi:hypothetical protein
MCSRAVAVAQSVEPRVVVPVVAGSNPVRHPSIRPESARRISLARCKSGVAGDTLVTIAGTNDTMTLVTDPMTRGEARRRLRELLAGKDTFDGELDEVLVGISPRGGAQTGGQSSL